MYRTIDLTVNVGTLAVVDAATGGSVSTTPMVVRGESALIRFHFVTVSGSTVSDFPIQAGSSLALGIKPEKKYGDSYLAYSANDQWNAAGDWASADFATGKCCCRVSLNTTPVASLLGDTTASVNALLQVEATDPDGVPLVLGQFTVKLLNDVMRGGEGDPAPGQPTYYTGAQVDALLTAKWDIPAGKRIKVTADGNIEVEDIT